MQMKYICIRRRFFFLCGSMLEFRIKRMQNKKKKRGKMIIIGVHAVGRCETRNVREMTRTENFIC